MPPRSFPNPTQIDKNSKLKSIKNSMPFGIGFWKDVGGFGEGKWSQVGTKMASKMDLILKAAKIKKKT